MKGLQKIMDRLNDTAKAFDMKINVDKTKVMKVSRNGGEINISIDGQKVEQVSKFKYLGAWITEDGRSEVEIRTRIGMAKDAFNKRKELLTRGMSKEVKKKIVKTVIWSVALYSAETWSLRKEDIRRIEALEMWIWRRMERISWTEKITNEEVLRRVGEKRSMVETIVRRKKNWIGHIMRGDFFFFFSVLPHGRSLVAKLSTLAGPRPFSSSLRTVHFPSTHQSYLYAFYLVPSYPPFSPP